MASAATPQQRQPFHDRFLDGSQREGPALLPLPGGEFLMGSQPGDPAFNTHNLAHRVVLSPFAVARFSVTNEEFAVFLNDRALDRAAENELLQVNTVPGLSIPPEGYPVSLRSGAAELPVTGVTWAGALAYTHWLSEKTGQVYVLPSEAQWEYAARGGARTVWPWGDEFDETRANCGRAGGSILPERDLPANGFGVRGTPGNVWEWVADCMDADFFFYSPTVDPVNLDPGCKAPMIRGGSFRDQPVQCSPGYRINFFARGYAGGIGFRVVRRINGPVPENAGR
jgi:formylglycine-generating enzyme required for sulfatase activity